MMRRLIVFMVVSVLISGSMQQFQSSSFVSSGLVDSYGNAISRSIFADSNGLIVGDGIPEINIGLIPPLSGNDIDSRSRLSPEPIVIIKPPPPSRKTSTTKTYTTAPTTTRFPVTFRTNPPPTFAPATFRTNPPPTFAPATVRTNPPTFASVTFRATTAPIFRTTQAPRIFTKPPSAFIPRQQSLGSSRFSSSEEGKFRGKSDDGTYRPRGNNGAYIHDTSGSYRHNNAGQYRHDDRGKYRRNQ